MATDTDALTYSIVGGSGQEIFTISPANGQVFVKDAELLDFETLASAQSTQQPELTLDVQVQDSHSNVTSRTFSFRVVDAPELLTVDASVWPQSGGLTISVEAGRLHVRNSDTAEDVIESVSMRDVGHLIVVGQVGVANHLTLQLVAGQLPLPIGGLSFTGGASLDDTVSIEGDVAGLAVGTTVSREADGRMLINWNGKSVTLAEIEHWIDNVAAATRNVTVSGALSADVFVGQPAFARLNIQFNGNTDANSMLDLSVMLPTSSNGGPVALTVTLGSADDHADFTNLPAMQLTVVGGAGNDSLIGNFSNNRLEGGIGNDTLVGGAGDDRLVGGAGDDTYLFREATSAEADTIEEAATEGIGDQLDFSNLTSAIVVDLSSTAAIPTTQAIYSRLTLTFLSANIENVTGGSGNDFLTGNSAANRLEGGAGNDQLAGKAGNDVYVFGAAAIEESDTLIEAAADGTGDQLNFSALPSSVPVTMSLVGATQKTRMAVHANRFLTLIPESLEQLIGGAGNDSLIGNKFNNRLDGRGGNDTITGGLGNDLLDGGVGTNTLIESGNVNFNLTDTSLIGVGTDVFANFQAANLTGGTSANTFTASGWTGTGVFTGGGGSDLISITKASVANFKLSSTNLQTTDGLNLSLNGFASATLVGGDGNDTFEISSWTGLATLTGGKGTNKVVAIRNANMTLNGNSTNASLVSPSFGTLTMTGITDAELTGGVGNNVFTVGGWTGRGMLVGAGGTDTVVSSRAANYLLSDTQLVALSGTTPVMTMALTGVGIAKLTGGTGNDTFTVSGWTGTGTIDGAGGTTDKIVAERDVGSTTLTNTTLVSTGLGTLNLINVETAILSGGSSDNTLIAAKFTLGPVTLQGADGDDVLIGGTKKDSLDGGSGRDLLIGGLEADTLVGGMGEDILIGGTSSHMANVPALNAIMAEWKRTDLIYKDRVANLRDAGVLNGTIKLNNSSGQNDASATDRLNGGHTAVIEDLDWFFQSTNDVLDAINNGVTVEIQTSI